MAKPDLTVLLVDESTLLLRKGYRYLHRLPITIKEVYRAERALAVCRREPPDLIFMAFDLPGLSGVECCGLIKADPILRHIPVVLICDEESPEQIEASENAGCDAIVTRPLDRREYLELANRFLIGLKEVRRLCRPPVRVRTSDRSFTANGFDISGGGMFIACSEPFPPGTSLQLDLLLNPGNSENPWITCGGTVGWINGTGQKPKPHYPPGVGVQFTGMTRSKRDILRQYLLSR